MMSTKKYRIRLTTDEQQELNALVSRGRAAAYKQTHARILLMSDRRQLVLPVASTVFAGR